MSRADAARLAFAAICAAVWLQKAVWSNPGGGWDFRVYYHAAQAWRAGADPYDTATLPEQLRTDGFKFNYPPFSLGLFAPFTRLPVSRALLAFTALKTMALWWLIRIWSRLLRTRATDPAWVLFLIFAFSSTIFIDFVSGSVTTFEQLLVWLGVAALLDGRPWAFVAAVVVASLFRLAPIGLLAACLVVPGERSYRYVLGGLAAFAAIFILTYMLAPQLTVEFVRTIPKNFGERGRLNPALGALVLDTADLVARKTGVTLGRVAVAAAFAALASAIVIPTIAVLRRVEKPAGESVAAMIYVVFLAYAAAMPRFRNYHYMLLIVPTYFVATRSTRLRPAIPLLLLACLPVYSWITTAENIALIGNYASWFLALGAWALCLYEMRRGTLLSPALP
jgi:hypothetical protein